MEVCKVYLHLKQVESKHVELHIGDNGGGFTDDIFYTSSNSLGVQLIHDLSEQLGGAIEKIPATKQPGTHYRALYKEII